MITKRIFLALITGVTAILVTAMGAHFGLSDSNVTGQDFEGSWILTVTPEGGQPFLSLSAQTADGSIIVSNTAGRASTGHGAWVSKGNRQFAFTFRGLRFDSQGLFIGTVKVRALVELNEKSDEFNGRGTTEVFNVDGELIFSFAVTLQGARIQVEPLE